MISRKIGHRAGEGRALCNLGDSLIKLERYSDALDNLQSALKIFQELDVPNSEAHAYYNLAELYQELGDLNRAIDYCHVESKMLTRL